MGGGRGWGGKMEGSETGGAWVGTGLGREDGGEADGWGRGWGGKMEGSETGGAWVGTGLGREDGGERDGRRVGGDETREGRWRGARRELARENGGQRSRKHHKHHCRLLWGSAKVERSMGGGSAGPCFAEARGEVNGAVLRG